MNKSLKWLLLAVFISLAVVVIDQNLNGIEKPQGDFSSIKMINLGAIIMFIIVAIVFLVSKYSRKGKN